MKGYTATYKPETILGEQGWSYQCFCDGRLIFDGWSRGKKTEAEQCVRDGIKSRVELLAVFANVPMAVA